MLALQFMFRTLNDCGCFVTRLPCFSFTLLLWMQWRFSRKMTCFPFISYPLVCGMVVFERDSNSKNHLCAFSLSFTSTNASSSNCGIAKFSEVTYDGNLLNFLIKYV